MCSILSPECHWYIESDTRGLILTSPLLIGGLFLRESSDLIIRVSVMVSFISGGCKDGQWSYWRRVGRNSKPSIVLSICINGNWELQGRFLYGG